jgi:hypothetical protein
MKPRRSEVLGECSADPTDPDFRRQLIDQILNGVLS